MDYPNKEESLTLEILEAIEAKSDVTQRSLARRMNVALGLANSYLRRCVRKGWIKIHQAPANRYLYYLTPTGFAEKSRLTGQYLSVSLAFYRKAADSCVATILYCRAKGWHRLVLCGLSDLTEIAAVRALEHDVRILAVCDPETRKTQFLNCPVVSSLDVCPSFDACVVTDMQDPVRTLQRLRGRVDDERILVPDILGAQLSTTPGESVVADVE